MTRQTIHPITPEAPQAGEWKRIVDGIYWARIPLPFRLNHVNVWLLEESDGWAIVDCGVDSPDVRAVWDRLLLSEPLAGRPVRRVLATHGHTDHVGCVGYILDRFDVPFEATLIEWLSARLRYADHQVNATGGIDAFLRKHGCDAAVAQSFRSERGRVSQYLGPQANMLKRIRGGDALQIGGRTWTVIIGRGHSEEHASLYCAEEGILIGGDQILPQISPVVSVSPQEPEADPLGDYLASFGAFADLAEGTIVLPGHGLPFQGLKTRIQELVEHHLQRLSTLEQAIKQPMTAFEATKILFRRAVEEGQGRLALGETLAHLHRLVKLNRAELRPDRDGCIVFRAQTK